MLKKYCIVDGSPD